MSKLPRNDNEYEKYINRRFLERKTFYTERIGDLLSWVMGRAPADSAWLTVMGNINSIAVATLADVSCIILVENAALDDNARQKAEMHGVNILTTEENAYQLAVKISKLLEG